MDSKPRSHSSRKVESACERRQCTLLSDYKVDRYTYQKILYRTEIVVNFILFLQKEVNSLIGSIGFSFVIPKNIDSPQLLQSPLF